MKIETGNITVTLDMDDIIKIAMDALDSNLSGYLDLIDQSQSFEGYALENMYTEDSEIIVLRLEQIQDLEL